MKRCVVGCVDPFAKVHGRGIQKLRDAGIEVTVGVLEEECRRLNRRFITFNEKRRPFVTLKWAQTADGYMDDHFRPLAISTPYTRMLVHKLRAEADAILVGRVTAERDQPRLDVRHWSGPSPRRIVIPQLMEWLYTEKCQSLIVEGGAETLRRFIAADCWDEIRVETACATVGGGTRAPQLPDGLKLTEQKVCDGNVIRVYER